MHHGARVPPVDRIEPAGEPPPERREHPAPVARLARGPRPRRPRAPEVELGDRGARRAVDPRARHPRSHQRPAQRRVDHPPSGGVRRDRRQLVEVVARAEQALSRLEPRAVGLAELALPSASFFSAPSTRGGASGERREGASWVRPAPRVPAGWAPRARPVTSRASSVTACPVTDPPSRAREAAAFVRTLVERLLAHDAPRAASAIAFDAFLSVIPLIAVAGWAISKFDSPADVVLGSVLDAAAPPVRDLVRAELPRLVRGSAAIPPVSALVFLWVTSSGLSAATAELAQVFGTPPPPFWRRRLVAIGWVIGGVGSIAVLGATTLALVRLVGGARFFTTTLPPLFVVVALTLFFRTAAPRKRAVALPGAVLTLGLWVLSSYGFAFYVATLARFATLYGGLAAVAMTMLWLWLLVFAMLVGAELNAMIEERLRADVSDDRRARARAGRRRAARAARPRRLARTARPTARAAG